METCKQCLLMFDKLIQYFENPSQDTFINRQLYPSETEMLVCKTLVTDGHLVRKVKLYNINCQTLLACLIWCIFWSRPRAPLDMVDIVEGQILLDTAHWQHNHISTSKLEFRFQYFYYQSHSFISLIQGKWSRADIYFHVRHCWGTRNVGVLSI